GYNEAMLVYLLALGSPTHPISSQSWDMWTSTYDKHWGTLYDQTYLSFGPLFGHQYTHVWVDFRGIRDSYMRAHGLDYFENSRRATYTQRRYAIANPQHWRGCGKEIWGFGGSDGPGRARAADRAGGRGARRGAVPWEGGVLSHICGARGRGRSHRGRWHDRTHCRDQLFAVCPRDRDAGNARDVSAIRLIDLFILWVSRCV